MKKWSVIMALCISVNSFGQDWKDSVDTFRKNYQAAFLKEERSPLKQADLGYLRFYEPDSLYQIEGIFKPSTDKKVLMFPTSSGQQKEYTKYGEISFELKGKKLQLNVYRSLSLMRIPLYKDYLFIPLKDVTSGKETYGGGRYLDAKMGDIQAGKIRLDFNKLYNPYCAFSEGFSCPIPPKENHLPIAIEAGEKNFAKPKD